MHGTILTRNNQIEIHLDHFCIVLVSSKFDREIILSDRSTAMILTGAKQLQNNLKRLLENKGLLVWPFLETVMVTLSCPASRAHCNVN